MAIHDVTPPRPITGAAKIDLKMSMVIPHQGCHAVAALYSLALQRSCQGLPSAVPMTIGIALDAVVWQARNNLYLGKQLAGTLE
jgi:hypothetical protein